MGISTRLLTPLPLKGPVGTYCSRVGEVTWAEQHGACVGTPGQPTWLHLHGAAWSWSVFRGRRSSRWELDEADWAVINGQQVIARRDSFLSWEDSHEHWREEPAYSSGAAYQRHKLVIGVGNETLQLHLLLSLPLEQ